MEANQKVSRHMSATERKVLIDHVSTLEETKGRRIRNANFCGFRAVGVSDMSDEEAAKFASNLNLDFVSVVGEYAVFAHRAR